MSEEFVLNFSALKGEKLKSWPKDAAGEPEAPALLTHCQGRNFEDDMLINMLEAYSIPAIKIYSGDGGFGKLILGTSGTGADILVPASLLEDAKTLMEANTDDELQSGI